MVEVVIPAGMVAWHGGDSAPADWDGGPVWMRCGQSLVADRICSWGRFKDVETASDIIAYTPRADAKVSERERVARIVEGCCQSMEGGGGHCDQYDAADAILAKLRAGGEVREADVEAAVERMVRSQWRGRDFRANPIYEDERVKMRPLARAALAPGAGGEGL